MGNFVERFSQEHISRVTKNDPRGQQVRKGTKIVPGPFDNKQKNFRRRGGEEAVRGTRKGALPAYWKAGGTEVTAIWSSILTR